MTFFTNLSSWTKCLYLITISKQIDTKIFAWRLFVDNELYFHFLLSFSLFTFVSNVFYAFKERIKLKSARYDHMTLFTNLISWTS